MVNKSKFEDLEKENAARYADFLKKDQAAFEAEELNKRAATAFRRTEEQEKYDKRDLLKADPVLGTYLTNQALRPKLDEWIEIEAKANQKRQAARQAGIRVDELSRVITIYQITAKSD